MPSTLDAFAAKLARLDVLDDDVDNVRVRVIVAGRSGRQAVVEATDSHAVVAARPGI